MRFISKQLSATSAKNKKRRERGFTLIEIMIVVVILGILATLVVPNIIDRPDHARQIRSKQDIQAIASALNLYRLDHQVYPATLDELAVGERRYLERMPTDPWGRPYQYVQPGIRGHRFDIFSYGADGYEGGTSFDADIGNWNLEDN